jgi:hypothetical protein
VRASSQDKVRIANRKKENYRRRSQYIRQPTAGPATKKAFGRA